MNPINLSEKTGSLQEQVYNEIECAILSGELLDGEALTEIKLSEILGVSRTPIREALRRLELEGLVQITPNKGASVIGVTEKDITDIYAIRAHIESLAVQWAAENMTESDKDELKEIIRLQEEYAENGDLDKLCETDGKFHELIYRFCKSRPLNKTLTSFHHYIRYARASSFHAKGRSADAVAEHRAIAEALFEGNGTLAAKLMTRHIGKAQKSYKKTVVQEKNK